MADDLLGAWLARVQAQEVLAGAHLVHYDALAVLKSIPPGSIDVAFCDPPYFVSRGGTTNRGGKRTAVDKGQWDRAQAGGIEAEHMWHMRWLRSVQRALSPAGTIWVCAGTTSVFGIGWAMQRLGYHVLNLIAWQKPNPPPNLGCRQFTHSCEYMIWAAPAAYKPLRHHFAYATMKAANGGKQMKDVWTIQAPSADEKRHGRHPTQKPLALLERVLLASVRSGAVVLDPFCGSGTAGVEAICQGNRFIGIDMDSAYLDIAAKRIRDALPPMEA